MFDVVEINKDSEELAILVGELDAFQSTLYPAESNHYLDFSMVNEEDIRCIIVRDDKGEAIGCGAIFLQGDSAAEIKRVYIRPQYRGNKIGERIRLPCTSAGNGHSSAVSYYALSTLRLSAMRSVSSLSRRSPERIYV